MDKSNVHKCHLEIHMKTDWKLVARISPSTMLRCHSKLKQIFVNYISTYKVQTHWFVMEIFVFPTTSADWNSWVGLITENSIIDFIRKRSEVKRRTTILSTWGWNRLLGTTDWKFHSIVPKTQLFAIQIDYSSMKDVVLFDINLHGALDATGPSLRVSSS